MLFSAPHIVSLLSILIRSVLATPLNAPVPISFNQSPHNFSNIDLTSFPDAQPQAVLPSSPNATIPPSTSPLSISVSPHPHSNASLSSSPAAARLQLTSIACDFSSPTVECATSPLLTPNRIDLAGYANPAWLSPPSLNASIPPFMNSSAPSNTSTTSTHKHKCRSRGRHRRRNPTVLRVANPLMAAISALNSSTTLLSSANQTLVLNRYPSTAAATEVQGLSGQLLQPLLYNGTAFPVSSWYVLRWDFDWYRQPGGKMPVSGILGPYVALMLQAPGGAGPSVEVGFYFDEGSVFYAGSDPGRYYQEMVLDGLDEATGWKAGGVGGDAGSAASLLASRWAEEWQDSVKGESVSTS